MYFYAENNDRIEKYLVIYNEESLRMLREEIIDNCSLIEHYDYQSYDIKLHQIYDDYCIKNYTIDFLYTDDSADFEYKDIYHYSYDIYYYPKLVKYIDEFLNGNVQILENAPDNFDACRYLQSRINEISDELDGVDNLDFKNKYRKMEELKILVNKAKLNENQKETDKYLERLNETIKLKLVDTLSIEETAKVDSFYKSNTKYVENLLRKRK